MSFLHPFSLFPLVSIWSIQRSLCLSIHSGSVFLDNFLKICKSFMDFISFNKSHTLRCFRDKFFSILAPVDVAWVPNFLLVLWLDYKAVWGTTMSPEGTQVYEELFNGNCLLGQGWNCCPGLVIPLPWTRGSECLYAFGAQCLCWVMRMSFLEAMDIDSGASGKYYHVVDLIFYFPFGGE